jgi:hypothetical protein
VNARLAEPDYQLVWPRALFKVEAARLLNHRELPDWNDRCELLLEDAFVRGYEGGPASEFRDVAEAGGDFADEDPWSAAKRPRAAMTAKQQFLRGLMGNADLLHEDTSHRRPYWRERRARQRSEAVLDMSGVVREFIALIGELEGSGYFEKRFTKDCVDCPYGDRPSRAVEREVGVKDLWPLSQDRFVGDLDLLFDVIELLHDLVARPQTRRQHGYSDCGWHHEAFDIESGRVVYRWRVNQILVRSDLGLRLAEEGDDTGRLVATTDDARTELVRALLARDGGEPDDQVRYAVGLFRARGADRNQKRSAVSVLALVLEERRHDVVTDALTKKDSGALFDIANNFHIRHQNADQKRDYDDFYLDWIFWVYLSTVELTNRVIDEQRAQVG